MNKIEELEAQLMAERIKVQIDLKEKYKWVIGKYVKHDDSFMIRIDDICHVHTSFMNGYADNLEPDDSIYINGTVAHCDVKNNYYSLSKDENIQVQAKDVISFSAFILASYSSAHALAASGGLLKFGSFTKPVVRSSFILELHQTLNLTSSHWAKSIATSSYNHIPPPFSELPLIFITN